MRLGGGASIDLRTVTVYLLASYSSAVCIEKSHYSCVQKILVKPCL